MDKKKIINIILGVVIIVIGVLLWQNMQNQRQQAPQGAPNNAPVAAGPVPVTPDSGPSAGTQRPNVSQAGIVVVAKKDIGRGTPISREMIRSERASDVSADDIESEGAVVGKIATIDIMLGERITRQKVSMRQGEQQLADKVPAGKRAMTIPIDKIASLEGMVRPNDRVDMIGTFPIPSMVSGGKQQNQNVVVPMFENIQVLAVGASITSMGDRNYDSITFALSQEESSLLIYALQMGTIRLLLRSPEDSSVSKVKMPVTINVLYDKLFAIQQQQQQQQGYMPELQEQGQPQERQPQQTQASAPVAAPSGVEVFTGGETSSGGGPGGGSSQHSR